MNKIKLAIACVVALSAPARMIAECSFSVPDLTGATGTVVEMPIGIENPGVKITSFNGKITLPEGVTMVNNAYGTPDFALSSRAADHVISAAIHGQTVSFAYYSGTNMTISGETGTVVTAQLALEAAPGEYQISLSDLNMTNSGLESEEIDETLTVTLTVTEPEVKRYGDNQLYIKDVTINEGEDAVLSIGYNSTSDVFEYSTSIVLPAGVTVSELTFMPVVADVANFNNQWEQTGEILRISGEYGGGRRDDPAEGGDVIIAKAKINTSQLLAGLYAIKVQEQLLSNDDDDFSPADYEAVLTIKGDENTYNLVHGQVYDRTETVTDVTVNYIRTFGGTAWEAFYVPFDMDYSEWADYGDIAEFVGVNEYDSDGDGLTDRISLLFNRIKSGTIEANKPYVFKPTYEGDVVFTSVGCTLTAAPSTDQSVVMTTAKGKYALYGTYSVKEGLPALGAYALSKAGAFVQALTPD